MKTKLIENKIEALWIKNDYNKKYLTGFTGTTSEVIMAQDKNYFITDGRYMTQVKSEIDENKFEVIIIESNMGYKLKVNEILNQYEKIGIESSTLTVKEYDLIKSEFAEKELIKVEGLIESLRIFKTSEEINKIKAAVKLTDEAYAHVIENIKPGMTELEVQVMAEKYHILNGAEGQSFTAIVASGKNGAKPHAKATSKVIEEGEMITLDFGCVVDGYCSDMTRSFVIGTPKEEEIIKIHEIVTTAMNEQIKAIKPGMKCKDIDKIGRDIITNEGYGKYFMHGTGHGVGVEVHEAPVVTFMSEEILEEGMIITIEPGIYVENLGGVRIEQDVVVTKNGYEILNQSPTNYDLV